jgi:hypothetical protein
MARLIDLKEKTMLFGCTIELKKMIHLQDFFSNGKCTQTFQFQTKSYLNAQALFVNTTLF